MGIVTIHRIDADDVITYLDDGFRRQAEEAGVPNLSAQTLGRKSFPFYGWGTYTHLVPLVAGQGSAIGPDPVSISMRYAAVTSRA